MNDRLAVELEKLWKAGAVDLPKAAGAFGTAAGQLHRTGVTEQSVFQRADGSMGDLYPEWSKLRNTLQDNVFGPSHDNLLTAGGTLVQVADDFADSDGSARIALDDYKKDVESGPVDDRPPTLVPDPPRHTDGHPHEPQRA